MLNPVLQSHRTIREWAKQHGILITIIALFILTLGLFYWRIIRGYTPPVFFIEWPAPPGWVEWLYDFRWLVRSILMVAGLGLAYLEFTAGVVSSFVLRALSTKRSRFITLGLMAAIIGTFLFQPGNYSVDDYRANVSAPWAVLQSIKQGEWFIYWTTYVHMGSPFMQFHNSIYYYFAALLGLLIPDFFDVSEVAAYILFILSGYTMYQFTSQLTGSRLAALTAAVAYCGSYYRFQLFSLSLNWPIDGLFFVVWPIQFYCIERVCSDPRTFNLRNLALVAIAVGAQLWTHPLHGAWMVGFGGLYVTVRIFANPEFALRERLVRYFWLAAAHGVGVIIGIYQIVPLLKERNFFSSVPWAYGIAPDYLFNVDVATQWGGSFMGYSVWLPAALGIVLAITMRWHQAYGLIAVAGLAIALTIVPYYFPTINYLLQVIPFGSILYARERYLYVGFGALAALAGVFVSLAAQLIERRQWLSLLRRWPLERLSVLLIAIILLENIPLTLWHSFKSPDNYLSDSTGRWPIMATLSQTTDKTARVYDAGEGLSPSFLYPMLTGHPGLSGHYEDAPSSFATSMAFDTAFKADLESGHISAATANLMYQLNLGYIITDGTQLNLPELELMERTESATLWRVPAHSPIVASAHPSPDGAVAINAPQGGDVEVTLYEHTETATTTSISFSLPQRAFVQLSYSAYPYQQVLLDRQPVSVISTPAGLIGFWAEAGRHTVQVQPELSALRKVTLSISGVTLLLSIVGTVFRRNNSE